MKKHDKIIRECQKELVFKTSRSGGPGGQNVNKVESKVTLKWDVLGSRTLNDAEKDTIFTKMSSKINLDGVLILYHQKERSQLGNKEKVVQKWEKLITKAFLVNKVRKATKPPKSLILKIKKGKIARSLTKKMRQKPKIQ